jgi:uncharacterized protein (DUF2249 family)
MAAHLMALNKIKQPNIKMTTETTSNIIDNNKVMDVRPIPCSIKHGLILKTWRELPVGDHFILLNDHDPIPLQYQFQAEFGGTFSWDYLERGPEDFRVKITKLHALPANPVSASPSTYGCSAH